MVSRSSIPEPITDGLELKRRRKHLRIHQSTLASLTGIHYQTLSKFERGKSQIAMPHARHFGLLFAWIELHGADPVVVPASQPHAKPAPLAPASGPVPTQALAPRPKCRWLDDQRVPLRHDPVTDLAHDALYWESQEQPDGTYGPWRHKIRINTMDEMDDVFID